MLAVCQEYPFEPTNAEYGPSRPGRVLSGVGAARGCDLRAAAFLIIQVLKFTPTVISSRMEFK